MPIERAWDYWIRHVEKAGLMPVKAAAIRTAAPAKAQRKAAKPRSAKSSAKKRR
jgi:hypothetical protein